MKDGKQTIEMAKGPEQVGPVQLEDMLAAIGWQVQEFYKDLHPNYAKIGKLLSECIDLSDEITSKMPPEIRAMEQFNDSLGNE